MQARSSGKASALQAGGRRPPRFDAQTQQGHQKIQRTGAEAEEKVRELGGTLSEDVSDYSSVLYDASSDSTESEKNKAVQKEPEDKPSPKKDVDAETDKKEAAPPSEAESRGKKAEVQATGRRSKQNFPEIPPGDDAPLHKGKPNAQGVRYPGYPKGDPTRCDSCEQLRRGFTRSSKAHRAECPWKVHGKVTAFLHVAGRLEHWF